MDRLIATLCVALMLFYAATIPAKAANQIQHMPGLMIAHDHDGPASFSVDTVHDYQDAHAEHHEDTSDSEGEPGDRAGGGHHHHGDSGPNLLVPEAASGQVCASLASLHQAIREHHIVGLRSPGPERPPRSITLTV
jgi:hypothetical protein